MLKNKALLIKEALKQYNPNVKCALTFNNIYELVIAVMLSAQTTDKAVNGVTLTLFLKYPTFKALSNARIQDVTEIIKPLGLSKVKAMNIIAVSKKIEEDFLGEVPKTIDELIELKGIGRKTANVILSEGFHLPGFAVDTHVLRTSQRIGLVDSNTTPLKAEKALKELFPKEDWHFMHLALINLGRTICTSKKPRCVDCPLHELCEKNMS